MYVVCARVRVCVCACELCYAVDLTKISKHHFCGPTLPAGGVVNEKPPKSCLKNIDVAPKFQNWHQKSK